VHQQAYAEMQRVSGQVDVLQNNLDDLSRKVSRLEAGGQNDMIKADIAALKSSVAELRRQMLQQRDEIVKDLAQRIVKMQPRKDESRPGKPRESAHTGPCLQYVVQSGDSLYMIALAFKTSVAKIKEMNNLSSNTLKVGQKLIVPQVKEQAK
jgi:hypothetical protein